MKIGIMLRHLGQHGGGVLVYTENLIKKFSEMDSEHEFVFIYNDKRRLGKFSNNKNVKEVYLPYKSKISWDQIGITYLDKKEGFDLIFNPKYSLPLALKKPCVFVCHGLDWYVMPWGSKLTDRVSHKILVPLYSKKAERIIAVSDTTKNHLVEYLGVDEKKIKKIYLGIDDIFHEPVSKDKLINVKRKYRLPDKYYLYVGQIYPPKNFGRLLKAYALVGPDLGVPLVVAGSHTWLCDDDIKLIESLNIEKWVVQAGWVSRDDLPVFYKMAGALLMPSLYEACPSPPIEAMASECPVLTSDRYGTKEIAGGAALLVNPECIEDIAEGMRRILLDEELRASLISSGRQRAKYFSWDKCVLETIALFEDIMGQ